MLIHTFELCVSVSLEVNQACRDFFFLNARGHPGYCYEQKEICQVTYNGWASNGIVVYLRNSKTHISSSYIHLRITPTKLLGCLDPTALFHANDDNISALNERICSILDGTPLSDLQFYLFRVDLCQDHKVENEIILLEYIRLLKKGASHSWNTVIFGNEQDEHSCRRVNTRYQITAYDKLYQLDNRDISFEWHSEQQLLRVEVAILSLGICHMSKKFRLKCDSWQIHLLQLEKRGEKIVSMIFGSLIPPGDYYSLREAKEVIMQSGYSKAKREALYSFLEEINHTSEVNTYTVRCYKNWKKRLIQLASLNINPVTIRSRAGIRHLPSLYPKTVYDTN